MVADSVDLAATPDAVWALIGRFGGDWHPLIAKIKMIGSGVGQLRVIETIDGKQIIERLDAIDDPAGPIAIPTSAAFRRRITPGRSGSSPKAPAALSNGARNISDNRPGDLSSRRSSPRCSRRGLIA